MLRKPGYLVEKAACNGCVNWDSFLLIYDSFKNIT